jgi:hypothetical protein
MENSIRRRNNVNKMTYKERREFNIQQREKYPENPRPYLPVECAKEGCFFHFIPIDNAYEALCPLHRIKNPRINPCPFMGHELADSTFFTWGIDEDLCTDFNHANYTPVR